MEVSSINQDPIVNIEVSSVFYIKVASFVVDSFEHVVDVVMQCTHSVEPFFCSGGGEFVVVIEVYGTWIKAIETSIWGEFVGRGGYGIAGKFCEG